MKTRSGFVSNSSSSSFIVAYDDEGCFSFLKGIGGRGGVYYSQFMSDVARNVDDAKALAEHLQEDYRMAVDDCWGYLEEEGNDAGYRLYPSDPMDNLLADARRLGVDSEAVRNVVERGAAHAREMHAQGMYTDGSVVEPLAVAYSDAMLLALLGKWAHVSVIGYADENGDFFSHMEHEFMRDVEEAANGRGYAVVSRNEH